MLKWILLFVFAYLVFRWWSRATVSDSSRKVVTDAEQMIECAQCGVHFPRKEAILDEGLGFCTRQHSDTWKQSH